MPSSRPSWASTLLMTKAREKRYNYTTTGIIHAVSCMRYAVSLVHEVCGIMHAVCDAERHKCTPKRDIISIFPLCASSRLSLRTTPQQVHATHTCGIIHAIRKLTSECRNMDYSLISRCAGGHLGVRPDYLEGPAYPVALFGVELYSQQSGGS